MTPEFLQVFAQFGPLGLIIAYLVWDKTGASKERMVAEKERTESDKALAAALSALTVTIQHLESRIK